MQKAITLIAFVLSLSICALAQGKTNDAINRQIRALGAEKAISVDFDPSGGTSKIKAVTENFSSGEVDHAGIMAMNFAMGFFYPGTTLTGSPDSVLFSFWVLTKKPRFADNHKFVADLGGGRTIDLGDGRYSPRARDNMEYLNFEITRTDLAALAADGSVTFHLGPYTFTLTPQQQKVIRSLVRVVDTSLSN